MNLSLSPAKFWPVILLLVSSFTIAAQSPSAPALTLIVEPSGTTTFDPVQNPTGHPFATDTARVSLVVEVADTANITVLHVKLGTSGGGSQLALQDFAFDVNTGLPAGMSYRREGNAVYLTLGSFSGFNAAYATVSTGNGSGSSADATASFL